MQEVVLCLCSNVTPLQNVLMRWEAAEGKPSDTSVSFPEICNLGDCEPGRPKLTHCFLHLHTCKHQWPLKVIEIVCENLNDLLLSEVRQLRFPRGSQNYRI